MIKKKYYVLVAGLMSLLLLGACGNHAQTSAPAAQTAAATEIAEQQTNMAETTAVQTETAASGNNQQAADKHIEKDVEPENAIGKEKAKQLALEKAALSEDQVTGLYVDFDMDDGRAEYEVTFYEGRTEYDVTLDALTGDIMEFEKELD